MSQSNPQPRRFRRKMRSVLRWTSRIVGVVLGLVVVLVLLVLLIPANRRIVLNKGLEFAQQNLPGELTVTHADWPGLGRLELDNLLWVDGPDTLAQVDTLRLAVDISDLLKRDVTVRHLLAAGIRADLPSIEQTLPAKTQPDSLAKTTDQPPTSGGPFPRSGALAPIPSLAIERLAIRRVRINATPTDVVHLDSLTAKLELRHNQTPDLSIMMLARPRPDLGVAWRLTANATTDTLSLNLGPLHISTPERLTIPRQLPLCGRLALPRPHLKELATGQSFWPTLILDNLLLVTDLGTWNVDANLAGRNPGRLVLQGDLATPVLDRLPAQRDTLAAQWAHDGAPGAALNINLTPPSEGRDFLASQVNIQGDLHLPKLSAMGTLLPPEVQVDQLSAVLIDLNLDYDGQTRPPNFRASLDLGRTAWLNKLQFKAHGDTTQVFLDTLAVDLPGLQIAAAGQASRQAVNLQAQVDIPDVALLNLYRPAGLDSVTLTKLREIAENWAPEDAPHLAVDLQLTPPANPATPLEAQASVQGRVRLPAPSTFAELLPEQAQIEALQAIHGDFDVQYDGLTTAPSFNIDVDFNKTEWLNTVRLKAHGDTADVFLDTLNIQLPSLSIVGAGRGSRQSVDLELAVQIPDAGLLKYWNDPKLAGLDFGINGHVKAAGSWPIPHVDLTAHGHLVSPQATIGELALSAVVDADTVALNLDLPQGVQRPQQNMDTVSVSFHGAMDDSLQWVRGQLTADARGPNQSLWIGGHLKAQDLKSSPMGTFAGDSLGIVLAKRDMKTTRPWQIKFALADSSLNVSDLHMEGELGQLDLTADVKPDSVSADLGLALQVVLDSLSPLLPEKAQALLPKGVLQAKGDIQAAGSPALPWASGDIQVSIAENPDLADLSFGTQLTLTGRGDPPASLNLTGPAKRAASAWVALSLNEGEKPLSRTTALIPLPQPDAEPDSVDVHLNADQMDLAKLKPLLPKGSNLSGLLDLDARVAGMMTLEDKTPDLALSGGLNLKDLRLELPDGSWMAMHGNLDLEGTSLAPIIRGGLDIQGGLLRIPALPPSLLPTTGEALLWETAAQAQATAAAVQDKAAIAQDDDLKAFIPDLTFKLTCPGSLWLRGQGLDVEMAGDLTIKLIDGLPAIGGELEAKQGTMKQLGHVFRLDRGRVVFYADEKDINPELDMSLSVRVDKYNIRIILSGTANEPLIEFTSAPDLEEGDIFATLLFGKPLNDLNDGQSNLIADRAGQLAAAYGSAKLQEGMGRELGIDVVTIAPREGDSETNALTVGKYLNPKVMVRYEQLLEDESAYFVHLDYSLTRQFKIHSQVSQGEASGIELKWEQDW